jgi:hypothetical protein
MKVSRIMTLSLLPWLGQHGVVAVYLNAQMHRPRLGRRSFLSQTGC